MSHAYSADAPTILICFERKRLEVDIEDSLAS